MSQVFHEKRYGLHRDSYSISASLDENGDIIVTQYDGNDEILEIITFKAELVKQERYRTDGNPQEDLIDRSFRHLPWEQFVGAMRWTIDKYFDRLGKKDDLEKEAYKIMDYATRFHGKVKQYVKERKENG